jgi:homeodomain-containing protein
MYRRFLAQRMEGLRDEPRPGAPRTIEDQRIEAVISRTLESQPKGATHWSSRGMARQTGLSVSTVQRICRAFGLKPHRQKTFKLSTDPDFVAKVRDVVGLYLGSRLRCRPAHYRTVQACQRSRAVLAQLQNRPNPLTDVDALMLTNMNPEFNLTRPSPDLESCGNRRVASQCPLHCVLFQNFEKPRHVHLEEAGEPM